MSPPTFFAWVDAVCAAAAVYVGYVWRMQLSLHARPVAVDYQDARIQYYPAAYVR